MTTPRGHVFHISQSLPSVQKAGSSIFTKRVEELHHILSYMSYFPLSDRLTERSQAGRGLGQGDHFLLHKFIERSCERWANSAKQLLIASRGHQHPEKQPTVFEKREKKSSSTHQITDASFPWPGNLDKPIILPHPLGETSTIKRNHRPPEYRKATPNIDKLTDSDDTEGKNP